VRSLLGRFLEHSRIFWFQGGHEDPLDGDYFIGSADWMYRNLEQRVEAVCPVSDRAARLKLQHMIDVMSTDARCAWSLRSDGRYVLRSPGPDAMPGSAEDVGTFEALMRDASSGA
jgi:polyphosphate kinase